MNLTITNEQQVKLYLHPVDSKGKPGSLNAIPVWAVASGSCTVVPAADGLSCMIVSGDLPGDSELNVSVTLGVGTGAVTLSEALRVTVVGAQAAVLGLTQDAPTYKGDVVITLPPPPIPTDAAAIMAELSDVTLAGYNTRLGQNYTFYHPTPETFPDVYLRPLVPITGVTIDKRSAWSEGLGGPATVAAGDFSSTQGQLLYKSDATAALVSPPVSPNDNESIGIDCVHIYEWDHAIFTEAPINTGNGDSSPDSNVATCLAVLNGKLDIGLPIGVARGPAGYANSGLILFSKGLIMTAGTVTAFSDWAALQLPANKKPTAIAITSRNEFAVVTVIDTDRMVGQVCFIALWGGQDLQISAKSPGFPADWPVAHPGLPNPAVFTGMKILGYVDLPFVFPTGISAIGGPYNHNPISNKTDGNAGSLEQYDLNVQADRDNFNTGGGGYAGNNSGYVSRTGAAVVIAKYENKACFLDLTALFMGLFNQYFTTQANYDATKYQNPGNPFYSVYNLADTTQFPFGFDAKPAWTPTITKTVDVTNPTAVLMSNDGLAMTTIASPDGTLSFFNADGTPSTVTPSLKVGPNVTCLAYDKKGSGFWAVSRGDRSLIRLSSWGKTPGWGGSVANTPVTVLLTIKDPRMVDPVHLEVSDTHSVEVPILTVADFGGRQILNYRYGPLLDQTGSGASYPMGATGADAFECAGVLAIKGAPFRFSGSNVN